MKLKPYNWYRFFKRVAADKASGSEIGNAKYKASGWVTCACGTVCAKIPRSKDGEPLDSILSEYGMDFYHAIDNEEWKRAEYVLSLIERRASVILTKMRKKK